MRQFTVVGSLLLGGLLALAGCGGGGGGSSSSGSTSTSPFDTGPRAAESPVDEALAKQGEVLFKSKTCSTCHGFGVRITGPDLNGVTQRRSAAWMEQQMLHPDVMTKQDPISHQLLGQYAVQMPNLMLKPEEVKSLIEFLKYKNKTTVAAH